MKRNGMKSKVGLAVLALVLGWTGLAGAHATSIGYTNSGPGSVTVWLGTYQHGGHHLEGSMNLVGVMGNPFPSTTVPFTILTCTGVACKPAGLVDGVNNFYTPDATIGGSAPLSGSEAGFLAGCPACGPTNHWQGAVFTGLGPGSYQFTWTPIANPSAEWSLFNTNMNGIFDLTGVIQPPGTPAIPEPSTILLFGSGLIGLGAWRMRKAKQA